VTPYHFSGKFRFIPGVLSEGSGLELGPARRRTFRSIGCFPEADMEVQFTVNLVELKRAVRRLLTRLPDQSAAGDDSIVFHASRNSLEIVAGGTSEVLGAAVVHPGKARVPHHVFRSIARSLQFHGGRCHRHCGIARGVKDQSNRVPSSEHLNSESQGSGVRRNKTCKTTKPLAVPSDHPGLLFLPEPANVLACLLEYFRRFG
jgi:hypothetical protein